MRVKYCLPLILSISFVSLSDAQYHYNSSTNDQEENPKEIFSSSWECDCFDNYDWYDFNDDDGYHYTGRKSRSRYYNRRYRMYYSYGIEHEFDMFSYIGANPAVYGFSPYMQTIHYNRVNGLFLGIDSGYDDILDDIFDIQGLDLAGKIGYSFGQKNWQYQAGVEKPIGRDLRLGFEFHNTTATDDYWRSGLTENSLSSVVAGYDYHDYYKAEGFSGYLSYRLMRTVYLGGSYNTDTYSSLDAVEEYNIFGEGNIYRVNPIIDQNFDQVYQQSVGFSLNINPRMHSISRGFATGFKVRGEVANLDGSNNDYFFNKYIIESKSILRLDRATFLRWRAMGGAITGDAPDFKDFYLGGIGTMRAAGYKSISGNAMVLSNLELVFGRNSGFDMGFFELDGIYLTLFLDSGWAEYNSDLADTKDPFGAFSNFAVSDLQHSGGVGIGCDIVRFEFAKPLSDSGGFSAFWIRLNPTF